jgi:16S rRNA (guanine527-N7)-methyltransferase
MLKILNLPYVDNQDFAPLCQAYAKYVSYWNTIINLVSSRDVDNLLSKLIVQSVRPLETQQIKAGSRVLDVGSGAGIPAFPLKFARPDLSITLLEPRRKKMLFLKRVAEELELNSVEVIHARLEEVSTRKDLFEAFDLITTRGTGRALDLFPLMEPLLRPGGTCWFYKGLAGPKEAHELLQVGDVTVEHLQLDKKLSIIVVRKVQ